MIYKFCKKNFLYILCALICIVSGSIFACMTQKRTVFAQENCCTDTTTNSESGKENDVNFLSQNYTATASTTDDYFCLTDDNMMFIENQSSFGTCWIFSGMKALESYLQMTTGVLYDFSESWISVCAKVDNKTPILGGGADFIRFYSLVSKYGLLFEEEFPYEWLYNLDDSNYQEIFNNYRNKTTKKFTANLDSKWFNSSTKDDVKQYLVNYGALSISYNADQTTTVAGKKYSYFYGTNALSTNHSITLIGWDDNVVFKDKDGKDLPKGAYICLNNWGTAVGKDEVIYISYDSSMINWTIFGFKQKSTVNNFTFYISSSNSSVDNFEIGKYDYSTTNLSSGTYQDKSMFFYGDIIDVDFAYQFNNKKNNASIKTKITKDGQDVTNLFSRHFINKNQNKYEIETNKAIDSGRYFVEFSIDYNGDKIEDENYVTALTVLSGVEMCLIDPSSNYEKSYTEQLYTQQSFNKINSVENTNYVYGYTFTKATVAQFELSNYSLIGSVELTDKANSFIHSGNSLVPASSNSYAKNKILIQFNFDTERKAYERTIDLRTTKGYKVTFKIITYALEENNDVKTFVFFNNNGGLNNSSLVSWIATGKNYNMTLSEPTNIFGNLYTFAGWYTDKSFTQLVTNLNANAKTRDLSNYTDKQYSGNSKYVRKYIYVYAKWDKVPFYMEGANLGEKQYGDNVRFELNLAHNGSGNYRYSIDSSSLPNGTMLVNENGKYYILGDLLCPGDFSFNFVCYDIDKDTEISANYTLSVNKREITILINDKSSVFGEALENLDYEIQSGSIYGDDNLNIQLRSSVADDSPIGSYSIYGSFNNENYDVTFISGTYKITKKRIVYTLNNYAGVYDGQEHSVTLDISRNLDTVKAEYSLDGINYVLNPIVEKNFTDGKKIIYIKLSCDNYETEQLQSSIEISKKLLSVDWANEELTYNGNQQVPSALVDGLVDDAKIIVTGYGLKAGNYTALASVDSNNYQLSNTTKTFTIKKAKPNVTLSSDDVSKVTGNATIGDDISSIALPAGYEWVDPTQKLKEGANILYVKYTPSDLENYEVVDNISMTIYMQEKSNKTEVVKYAVVAICGGIILVIIISIITTISRKAYERSCLDNHDEKGKKKKFDKDDQITIYFVTNSPISLEPIRSLKRISIDLPKLERNYYEFAGWYTDRLFINPYKNNGTEKTVTLYAKWLPKMYK